MVKTNDISLKPSRVVIAYNRIAKFIYIGIFLHIVAILAVVLFVQGVQELSLYQDKAFDLNFYTWVLFTWFAFWVPLFSELDAYSRLQNYKLVKDKLYVYGYDYRLVKPFMLSKCQRFAVIAAAKDLNLDHKVQTYYYSQGYRWYHIIPDQWIQYPFVLVNKLFWKRILFTQYYKLQNFYW